MKKDVREEVKKMFRESGIMGARLPENVDFLELEKTGEIELVLKQRSIGLPEGEKGPFNMQEDGAAFEAWALFIKAYGGRRVKLSVEKSEDITQNNDEIEKPGHYNRFLYRALKFSEQYGEWFSLSNDLANRVDDYRNKLFGDVMYRNNYPICEATDGNTTENIVESLFANKYKKELQQIVKNAADLDINSDKVFRQLPVGLFKNEKSTINMEFTKGHSALDLWAIADQDILLFELKTENKMVGIITELMFYSNYVNDVFIEKKNNIKPYTIHEIQKREGKETINRGYDKLVNPNDSFKKIHAFMLTDGTHVLITDKVINEMNKKKNAFRITYGNLKYKYENGVISPGKI